MDAPPDTAAPSSPAVTQTDTTAAMAVALQRAQQVADELVAHAQDQANQLLDRARERRA